MKVCHCALPSLTGNSQCCEFCPNNPQEPFSVDLSFHLPPYDQTFFTKEYLELQIKILKEELEKLKKNKIEIE